MDKKIIKGGLFFAAVGLTVASFYAWFKKIEKQIEDDKQANDEELEQLGVPTDKLREEVDSVEDENNIVKALAVGTMFNPNWDFDIIDPEKALKADHIICVTQEVYKGGRYEQNDLVFYFDIPNYLKGGYKSAKIGDYITAFKAATEHAWTKIVRFCPKPKGKLIGMIAVSYDDPEDPEYTVSERVEIDDPEIYSEFADDFHDGLAAFYESVIKKTVPESVTDKLTDWVNRKWNKKLDNFQIVEIQLVYRISFKMQDHEGIGINYKTALDTLKYFTDELVISKRGSKDVKYENVLFCAPSDKTGKHDLTWYYCIDENNRIIADSFCY